MRRLILMTLLAGGWAATCAGDAPQQAPEPPVHPVAAVAEGVAHYRAGRYQQGLAALRAWIERRTAASLPVPAEARLDAALCALRLLRSRDAELLVAPLLRGDVDGAVAPDQGADDAAGEADVVPAAAAAFVLALASCQHAERAVVAAGLADAEPMAWAMAERAIRTAELQFRRCVALRPDWPEAVRNLERTLRRRVEIAALREQAQPPDAKKEDAPEPEPEPPQPDPEQPPEVVIPEAATAPLGAAELRRLRQRVRERQAQKLRGRQQQRGADPGGSGW